VAKAKKQGNIKRYIRGISSQNKDVLYKVLSENYANKSFNVYGLNLPRIKRLLPTNLPVLSLNERRVDNVFLLEGNIILILEYESSVKYKNLIKYGHYAFRILEKYYKDKKYKILIVVIYTGEIESAPNSLDAGSIQLSFEQVFLSKFDGTLMYDELKEKIRNNETLNEEDIMRFIILPLTKNDDRQKFIKNTFELAKEIKDDAQRNFIVAGILSATYKFIDKQNLDKIWGWIEMTDFSRLIEERKDKAVKEAVKEAVKKTVKEKEEEKIEAVNKKAKEKDMEYAIKMLRKGMEIVDIMELSGLQRVEILNLKKELTLTQ